jgi:hypothetical protein
MKHFAKIQIEFIKKATKWDDLSFEKQKEYLQQHPKSKRKITKSQTQLSNVKEKLYNAKEWDSAFADIDDIQDILNDASSFLEYEDINAFKTEVGDAADINIAFPVENKQTKAIQETLNKIETFEGSHLQFEILLDKLQLQRKQLAINLGLEKSEPEPQKLEIDDDPNWTYTDGTYNYEKNMTLYNDTYKILKNYNDVKTTKESDAEADNIIEGWIKQTNEFPFSDNFNAYTKKGLIKAINQDGYLPRQHAINKDFHNTPEKRAQLVKSFAEKVFKNQQKNNQ